MKEADKILYAGGRFANICAKFCLLKRERLAGDFVLNIRAIPPEHNPPSLEKV